MKPFALVCGILLTTWQLPAREVLIVADEFPAMEAVAARLKTEEHVGARVVSQKELPNSLKEFETVAVYIHGVLSEKAEHAFIDYAQGGGKLVLLHHSISSGKRKNADWFSFLGVALPQGDLTDGGYKWIEGVSFSLVNLNPHHFITTNRVVWPEKIAFAVSNSVPVSPALPGVTLHETEVYLNHVHTGPHTLLLGLKFTDPKSGRVYMQDTPGWIKPAGKGWVIYLMPGHTKHDFETDTYGRIVLNAIIFKPSGKGAVQ